VVCFSIAHVKLPLFGACQKASEAMTAFPSAIPESTAAEQRAHEPSMEEILASIRKIISDDQPMPLSSRPEPVIREERLPPQSREPEPDRSLDRNLDRMRPPSVARPSVDFSGAFVSAPPVRPARPEVTKPVAEVREIGPRPAPQPRLVTKEEQPLLSDQADMVVNSSFQVLNATRAMPTPQIIENVSRELLRPMLKQWLDDNLPTLVERLVRAEIERVARGR
jgi:cell pole-organizing protein PopZ